VRVLKGHSADLDAAAVDMLHHETPLREVLVPTPAVISAYTPKILL
jgi:hypothetical protein